MIQIEISQEEANLLRDILDGHRITLQVFGESWLETKDIKDQLDIIEKIKNQLEENNE